VPLGDAPLLGTSAGSWVAACAATATPFDRLCAVTPIRVPNPASGFLRGIASDLFGDRHSERVTASALRLPHARRALLSGGDHALADIVAASSAVPALFRPARIGRTWYVDGGVRSMLSADRAAHAQHLLAVAPIAGPMFGPAGRAMELMLREELRRWQKATGGTAHLIRPNRKIASLTRHPMQLFDVARAQAAYPLAYEQARKLITSRIDLAALVTHEELPPAGGDAAAAA
jgi:predicted acylesterase/phospholipase RssA